MTTPLSSCCNAPMKTATQWIGKKGTEYNICKKCHRPCTPTPPEEGWEKEFDEKLFEECGWFKELGNGEEDWSSVKDFIRSLLLSERNRVRKAVEGLKRQNQLDMNVHYDSYGYQDGEIQASMEIDKLTSVNKALDDMLKLI